MTKPVHDGSPGERRLELLRALAAATASSTTAEDVSRRAAGVLTAHSHELPFVLLYLVDEERGVASLTARTGLEPGAPAAPPIVSLADDTGWPLAEVFATRTRREVLDVERRFGSIRAGASPEAIEGAVIHPLGPPEPGAPPLGFLVAGVDPRGPHGGEALELCELVALQLASALGHARAFAAERRRLAAAGAPPEDELRFRTVVHQAATGVVQADASGRMTLVNQRWCEMLGYSEGELRSALESALEISRPVIEAQGHHLLVDIPDEPLVLDADPIRISQVVSNLLHNAAKFTPNGGRIILSAQRDRAEVVIHVIDTGVGIPPDMLPRVFDLFTQVGHTIDRARGGLGIGLSLAKQLVEMHGGSITADSPGPGQGSDFTVRLPLAGADTADPVTRADDSDAAPHPADRRILVVDDNVDAAETLAMLLEDLDHDVRIAHSGVAALDTARVFAPALVFLDIGLPDISGYEVARALRAEPGLSEVVLIALTGYGSEADKALGRSAGFDLHLTKPVHLATVEDVLIRSWRSPAHARPSRPSRS